VGPDIDLTFGYNLVADGSGGFGFDFAVGGAVPETSTWAMMLIGFAGLGYAGYRRGKIRPRNAGLGMQSVQEGLKPGHGGVDPSGAPDGLTRLRRKLGFSLGRELGGSVSADAAP
jgi:hypothetical protein